MIGILGGAWLVLIAFATAGTVVSKKLVWAEGPAPGEAKGLGLAVELAATAEDFERIVGAPGRPPGDENRRRLRTSQRLDVPMILAYGVLFLGIGWLESGSSFRGAPAFGWITQIAIVCAALFDFAEDRVILRLIDGSPGGGPRRWGLPKWTCYFLALTAAAPFYLFPPEPSWVSYPAGILLLLGGLCGLAGSLGQRAHWIELGLSVSALGILAMGLVLGRELLRS